MERPVARPFREVAVPSPDVPSVCLDGRWRDHPKERGDRTHQSVWCWSPNGDMASVSVLGWKAATTRAEAITTIVARSYYRNKAS